MKTPDDSVQRSRALAAGPNEALALLHFAFRAVVAEPDAELAERGLGRVHHRILFFIARTPGLRVSDLLSTLAVTKQALHLPLQQLIRKKLVSSAALPSNLRERRLRLTASGKALERVLSGHQRGLFAAAFRKVGLSQARGWRAVMQQLVNAAPANRR